MMDEALRLFADRLTVRERSRPGKLSPQSMADAWAQFQKDWELGINYENFLLDLSERIYDKCPNLEFIDTHAKHGATVVDSFSRNITLRMINWNGYWDDPLVVGYNLQLPRNDHGLTGRDFVNQLPQHLDTAVGMFVKHITDNGWTAFARLEIPAGCADTARWVAPLRLVRHFDVNNDIFISRFDMIGGKPEGA